ncbi:non-ribosomal peptide synthetase [Nocardiopsis potens]|uniref:non-ribosomal peptide synthetase n=1 Tax=Nocardiopsis potens TaxID=1246458 RepID=UPI000349CDB6|nr:non-ribosomal peptide synthetase [Nocardiopsis potens]
MSTRPGAAEPGARTAPLGRLFEDAAARYPDAVALVFEDSETTYADLGARADRLASHLVEEGVGRGDVVGVLLPRGTEFVVSVLAVLKAGAAYTALDPELPESRLRAVAEQAKARILVTREHLAHLVPGAALVLLDRDASAIAGRPARPLSTAVHPDDPACLIFTSGSTGRPKGVLSSHRTISSRLLGQDYAAFGPGEVWIQSAPMAWDAGVFELFAALLFGSVCVLQPGGRPDPAAIAGLVRRHGATSLYLSAGLFALMADEYPRALGVGQVLTGGEASSPCHMRRVRQGGALTRLVHVYGPVETMIFATAHTVGEDDTGGGIGSVPLGGAVAATRTHVLDPRLREVRPGEEGELYIGGDGLAYGYIGEPSLTAERFVPDPFGTPGGRLFRSGDRIRVREDGLLEFVGRYDDQVKIRGFRVEPREVEAAICREPDAAQAAVTAVDDPVGGKRLIAYVVPRPGADLDGPDLRRRLLSAVPDHMVPSVVAPIGALPLSDNGKVDREALRSLAADSAAAPPPPRAGAQEEGEGAGWTPLSRRLAEIWGGLLGVEDVRLDDDFFALGGHSLSALRAVSLVRRETGVHVPLSALMDSESLAHFAERVRLHVDEGASRPALTRAAAPPD